MSFLYNILLSSLTSDCSIDSDADGYVTLLQLVQLNSIFTSQV